MAFTENRCYQYPELFEDQACIRLLKIRYGQESRAELSCEIQVFSLAQCPPYKALSYTWGNPFPQDQVYLPTDEPFPSNEEFQKRAVDWNTENNRIRCNDGLILVSLNLFEALTQLADFGETAFLWIDRLCINQENNEEKSIQVAMMSKIYSQAKSVTVWLGRSGTDSLAALQIQHTFAGPMYDLAKDGKLRDQDIEAHDPGDGLCTAGSYVERFGLQETLLTTWFAWTQLFRRSWFYRRWTLQETAFARNIEMLCGDRQFDWHKLRFLVKYFRLSGWKPYLQLYGIPENEPTRAMLARDFVESAFLDAMALRDELAGCHGKFSAGTFLTEILYRSSMMQCSDPRDMIYGILGILQLIPETEGALDIEPDYKIVVLEVWTKVIKLCLESSPDLAILSLKSDPSLISIFNLPSWIPDLQALSKHTIDRRLGLDRRRPHSVMYNASYDPQNLLPYRHVYSGAFHLKGSRVGIVAVCAIDFAGGDSLGIKAGLFLPSVLQVCTILPPIMRGGQDRIQALWRTIVADIESYPQRVRPAPADLGQCFHDWILKLLFLLRAENESWPEILTTICDGLTKLYEDNPADCSLPNMAKSHVWWTRLSSTSAQSCYQDLTKYNCIKSSSRFQAAMAISGRLLFSTEGGDLGYGPISCLPGDEVWVLENGKIPFILRPTRDKFSFSLIGECYVHGIMDGQLFAHAPIEFIPLSLI